MVTWGWCCGMQWCDWTRQIPGGGKPREHKSETLCCWGLWLWNAPWEEHGGGSSFTMWVQRAKSWLFFITLRVYYTNVTLNQSCYTKPTSYSFTIILCQLHTIFKHFISQHTNINVTSPSFITKFHFPPSCIMNIQNLPYLLQTFVST